MFALGPIVENWPPEKDRTMDIYIKPNENTFTILPKSVNLGHIKNVPQQVHSLLHEKQDANYLII